jgi:arabinogalactan endo-1,4-beta-galactosidase
LISAGSAVAASCARHAGDVIFMRTITVFLILFLMTPTASAAFAHATSVTTAPTTQQAFIAGADVSMLPEIEKAGGVFSREGKPGDALKIMRAGGCNLFRVRLFVDPEKDFNKNHGATQDLPYVVALSKRIKATGAILLLDLHYSDTWADPGKQFKPRAWETLAFDALEKQVHAYTASVLKALADAGATPDMVQIGNEIAGGMLWPEGKVLNAPKPEEAQQWERLARPAQRGGRARCARRRRHQRTQSAW